MHNGGEGKIKAIRWETGRIGFNIRLLNRGIWSVPPKFNIKRLFKKIRIPKLRSSSFALPLLAGNKSPPAIFVFGIAVILALAVILSLLIQSSAQIQHANNTALNKTTQTTNYLKPNPFVQPDSTTLYYGSGDVNADGVINQEDYNLMQSVPSDSAMKDRADVNGNGIPADSSDKSILYEYINGSRAYLPGHWDKLATREEREDWFMKMVTVDKTDTMRGKPGWTCIYFADRFESNFAAREKYDEPGTFETKSRFNIPVYFCGITDTLFGKGHAVNALLTGDNPLNINDWVIEEPQWDVFIKNQPDSLSQDLGKFIDSFHWKGNIVEVRITQGTYRYDLPLPRGAPTEIVTFFYNKTTEEINLEYFNPNMMMTRPGTSVSDEKNIVVPKEYSLMQSYPNPANSRVVIPFKLSKAENISLKLYDVTGRELKTIVKGYYPAGESKINFDIGKYSSGMYFYRLTGDGISEAKRMVIIK